MILETLARVREQIDQAARQAGISDVFLVAATKTVSLERMKEAVAGGVGAIGENRVQEAKEKLISKTALPAAWHFIGHLQTNKAKTAVELFDMIQSLDRWELAQALDRHAGQAGKIQSCLVELKVSPESGKFGIRPEDLEKFLEALQGCSHLRIEGLMAMAPYAENASLARPYFRKAKQCFDQAKRHEGPFLRMEHLSMGMSHDFSAAIQEGATMVRIGTAIFGERPGHSTD